MKIRYETYSDYSCRKFGGCAYAFIIVKYVNNIPFIVNKFSRRIANVKRKTFIGELMGITAALKHIPDNSYVKCYTDAHGLEKTINRKRNTKSIISKRHVNNFKKERDRFDKFDFCYTCKNSNNVLHMICHTMANTKAAETPQQIIERLGEESKYFQNLLERSPIESC